MSISACVTNLLTLHIFYDNMCMCCGSNRIDIQNWFSQVINPFSKRVRRSISKRTSKIQIKHIKSINYEVFIFPLTDEPVHGSAHLLMMMIKLICCCNTNGQEDEMCMMLTLVPTCACERVCVMCVHVCVYVGDCKMRMSFVFFFSFCLFHQRDA